MITDIMLLGADAASAAAVGVSGNITQAIAGAAAAIGVGLIGSKAVEAVGRNPHRLMR